MFPRPARLKPILSALSRPQKCQVRHVGKYEEAEFSYRKYIEPKNYKTQRFLSDLMFGGAFFWMFFHILTNSEHLTGHGIPDPLQWTDEELGIPPDSEG